MADLDWSKVHKVMKYVDPAGRAAVDGTWKASTRSVNKTSDGLATVAEKWGINSKFPRFWEGQSEKDIQSIDRWLENTGTVAGIVYGGMSAAGGSSGGTSTGSGLGTGDGAFLGEGVPTGIEAWDGAAGGSGLGFDAGAMPEGSPYAQDIPTNNSWWQKAAGGKSGGMPSTQQSQPQQRPLDQKDWEDPERVRLEEGPARSPRGLGDYQLSSKRAKTPAKAPARRGLSDIDVNGAEIADLQRITKRVVALRRAVDQLKGARA